MWSYRNSSLMNRQQLQSKSVSGWSPTPLHIVKAALELAEVDPTDVLFDLGCGDGRVVVRAARMFGCRAIGFDIDPKRVRQTRMRIRQRGAGSLASVRRDDLMRIPDLHRASVVYLYLPQPAMNQLKPILRRRCAPGTRVVSTGAWFYNWQIQKQLMMRTDKWKWYIGVWVV